jgi:putative transposase
MNYRRAKTKGGTYFFTVVTHARKKILCYEKNIKLIKDAFKNVIKEHPFTLDAFVLLPDHFHCVWTLPENDNDFSTRLRLTKSYFTRKCNDRYKTKASNSRAKKKEQSIWQRRFWEHRIRDEKDYEAHVDYIHFNPVKHGYVNSPHEWKHSTFHRYVEKGIYGTDWGANEEIKFDLQVGNE